MKAVAKTLFAFSLLITVLMVLGADYAFAQEEMTMDEYNAQLQQWAQREQAAQAEIANCDAQIASTRAEISQAESDIRSTWAEIYREIGTTEAEVNAYRRELEDLDRQLNALGALSPEELFKRRKELDAIEEAVNEKKESRIYTLTEMRNRIAGLEGKIAQLRAKMPKGMYDEYTVMHGDYLWRISGKSYGDPMQWIRIYSFNTDQIQDPDLVYPDQIFKIHRENSPNEYLVSRGDNLFKISGNMDVMADPTKWRELYEANQQAIGDEPDLIYPYQVLKIPR